MSSNSRSIIRQILRLNRQFAISSAISQLSCYSSIHVHRGLHINTRSYPCPKVLLVRSQDAGCTKLSGSESKVTLSYTEDAITSHNDLSEKAYSDKEDHVNGKVMSKPIDHVVTEEKRAAKIHDFCFGIPFGSFVLSGGLVGFMFSRNPSTLGAGVLFGGALLALSAFSLNIWRQVKSSFPFIVGQAVISAALLWKNFQSYSMTKKVFPTGLYAVISAAMLCLCFYTYVVMSGGNPPPKKLKSSDADVPS